LDTTLPVFSAPAIRTRPPKYLEWDRRVAVQALLAALTVGVLIDQALQTDIVGAAGTVMVVVAAVALLVVRPRNRIRTSWLAMVIVLAPWLSIRTSPWLIGPTIIALVVLFVLAANADRGLPGTFPALGRGIARVAAAGFDTPREAATAVACGAPNDATRHIRRSVTGIAMALTLATVLLVLLASGDAFFASMLGTTAVGDHLVDLIIVIAGSLWWLSLVLVGRRVPRVDPTRASSTAPPPQSHASKAAIMPRAAVGGREVACVLATAAVVLGGYVSSLAIGALSGSEYVQRRTGLTYAEYARSGFFQLVAVVAIVGTVLIASRRIIAGSARRRQLLMIAMADAVFTLVMVVVSIVRLQTYRNVFGLTMLRFSTTVFAAWLGVVIVMIVVALVRTRWEPRLVAAVVVSAYATLLVTNIANPEAMVARENIDRIDWASGETRSRDGAEFDSAYLGTQLSDDAIPALVEHLDELPAEQRNALLLRLCSERDGTDHGWSWNLSRADAANALSGLCPR
jgi:hypothetical protein